MQIKILCAAMLVMSCVAVKNFAQKKGDVKIKFGKITPEDFIINSPVVDSNANAVILSDNGVSEFVGNTKGWFSIVFKRHKRVKIVNKNGYDAATVEIGLYSNATDVEKLEDLKANTYSIENGQLITTSLERKEIFEDKEGRITKRKFTFPAIKPGCIIEYSYTIKSDFLFNLQPWEFQGSYPCLRSEYEVAFPDFFNYVFLTQGYIPLHASSRENRQTFSVSEIATAAGNTERYSLSSKVTYRKWEAENLPALKEESFTSSVDNHISKIEFQLSQYRFPGQQVEEIMENWDKVSKRLRESEDFGLAYLRTNGWLNDDMKLITAGAKTEEEKARQIYEFVRSNFTCTNTYGTRLSDNTTLRDVFKKKTGRVSDINLLLLAMLKHEGIKAEPVLLSLRQRGTVHPVYPLMDRFNYVICLAFLSSGEVYLDASQPLLGFNKLTPSCYNGTAWVVSEAPYPIGFWADSVKERTVTSLFLFAENDRLRGYASSLSGDIGSYGLRGKIKESGLNAYSRELSDGFSEGISVRNVSIDSLNIYDMPLTVKYDIEIHTDEDIIYFNPLLHVAIKKNPFVSSERNYPVEMPYSMDDTYVLTMDIPKGYVVDEIPKSVRSHFNEKEGIFEYIFSKTENRIMMRCRLALFKANFQQEDYTVLREFFAFVIKKQSEQIVFKKIK